MQGKGGEWKKGRKEGEGGGRVEKEKGVERREDGVEKERGREKGGKEGVYREKVGQGDEKSRRERKRAGRGVGLFPLLMFGKHIFIYASQTLEKGPKRN